jgi:hypothetical protein
MCNDGMTDDPIFAEVSLALVQYKFCLDNTSHRNWWHRFKCRFGEPEARQAEAALHDAEERARRVVNATEAHRTALRIMVSAQPPKVRQIDNFLALCQKD